MCGGLGADLGGTGGTAVPDGADGSGPTGLFSLVSCLILSISE